MAAMNITNDRFNELLQGDRPVLVDYWAPWCGYCRRISAAYDKVAQQYADRIEVVKINIDDEPALAQAQGIEVIPTLVLYRAGSALASVTAPPSKAAIDDFIEEHLSK